MRLIINAIGVLMMLFMVSCSDNLEINTEVSVPDLYTFERNGESTVSFSGQTERIGMATELVAAMSDFDRTEEELIEMYANQSASGDDVDPYENPDYNASSKSVKSKVAASLDIFSSNAVESAEIKAQLQEWITSQVQEVFPNENTLAEEGVAGQIADGTSVRYINGKGLEYNQAVGKSLIGALMVDQISNNYLSADLLDNVELDNDNVITDAENTYTAMEHFWDEAYGYLFGFSADTADPLATLGDDNFLNKYLSRVENDSDFAGIAEEIFSAYKTGRAAIVAKNYELRDQQAAIIKERLAEIVAIRAVYYLQQGKVALSNGDFGGGFHDLSEGFGFIYSLRFARNADSNNTYFSRSEVDAYISSLTQGNGFWDVQASTLDEISQSIADKFDFTVEQAAE
jgi:hypothetical protein